MTKKSAGRPKRPDAVRVHTMLEKDVAKTIYDMEPRGLQWSYKINKILKEWIAKAPISST